MYVSIAVTSTHWLNAGDMSKSLSPIFRSTIIIGSIQCIFQRLDLRRPLLMMEGLRFCKKSDLRQEEQCLHKRCKKLKGGSRHSKWMCPRRLETLWSVDRRISTVRAGYSPAIQTSYQAITM